MLWTKNDTKAGVIYIQSAVNHNVQNQPWESYWKPDMLTKLL